MSLCFWLCRYSGTMIKILPLDFLVASHRIPWKMKNAVYRLQISALVPEIFVFEKYVKLKVPLRSNCRCPFFLHKSFRKILPNFNLLQSNITTHVFWTFISENLRPSLIFLVPVLVEKWSKGRHNLKNTTRVEITITIGTAILIKNNKKLCSYIRAIFCIN